MKIIWKILDYFFLTRPTLFFPLWTLLLAGRFVSGAKTNILWLFLSFAGLMGTSYVVNQIFDTETDRNNRKLFFLSEGLMPIRNAIIFVAILGIAGIAGLFLIGKLTGIWGLIFLLITGYGYNFPPFKWKNKPVWGIVVSVLGGGMAFFIGCSPYFNGDLVLQVMPYIFALTSVSLLTTVPDMEGDAVAGKKTFALRFGSIPTLRIALISCAFAVISGKVLSDNIIFWSALISLPLFIASTILKDIKIISLTIKYPIFILSVALALEYPWYFILIFGYFLFARWYYKKRFEIEYPSLGAE